MNATDALIVLQIIMPEVATQLLNVNIVKVLTSIKCILSLKTTINQTFQRIPSHLTQIGKDRCSVPKCVINEQSNMTHVDDREVEYFGKHFPTQEFAIKFASQDCVMATSGKTE